MLLNTLSPSISADNIFTLPCSPSFSLGGTLMSGQCFRWRQDGDGFRGVAFGRSVRISQQGARLTIEGDSFPDREQLWRHYLDLELDYDAVREEVLGLEPRLSAAAEKCGGIHILRQQPWEAFCSFVISQNNNIPRIRLIISRLCALCGTPSDGMGAFSDPSAHDPAFEFAFPSAKKVAALTVEQLENIGCGYRAAYIIEAARCALDGRFDPEYLSLAPISEARAALQSILGVGAKVADCVLLYGLHRLDAFPRDVWIKRALEGEFADTPLSNSRYAGVAQQYIFEHIRGNAQ